MPFFNRRTKNTSMTAEEIILTSRRNDSNEVSQSLIDTFSFMPGTDGKDSHLDIRTQVIEKLLADISLKDIHLIRVLFKEEMKCEKAIGRHDNLYQICFYLFHLRQLEDSFILYDTKFNADNFDVGCMLDREMMTVGHEVEEVIEYVKERFKREPELKLKYAGILDALNGLIECPDYDTIKDYDLFIRGYFYGHDNVK